MTKRERDDVNGVRACVRVWMKICSCVSHFPYCVRVWVCASLENCDVIAFYISRTVYFIIFFTIFSSFYFIFHTCFISFLIYFNFFLHFFFFSFIEFLVLWQFASHACKVCRMCVFFKKVFKVLKRDRNTIYDEWTTKFIIDFNADPKYEQYEMNM